MATKIALKTNDDLTINVERELILQCGTIKTLIEDLGIVDTSMPIPLPNVNSKVMAKIIAFCKHSNGQTDALIKKFQDKHFPDFEREFFQNEDHGVVLDIMMAANYLDLPVLLDACALAMALRMKDKGVEQLRSELGIENDFAPGELERLKAQETFAE